MHVSGSDEKMRLGPRMVAACIPALRYVNLTKDKQTSGPSLLNIFQPPISQKINK